ncbi:TIGR02234 family membrane protein [Nocardia sp. NPDC048505]|uniref:TIGR02234 family membrane protein n=1 Tax=unclassified Nocardia TaxID=2637762 RepID=UPI0033EF341E
MSAVPDQEPSGVGETRRPANGVRAPIILMALAAALMWGSSRMTWVTVSSADGLTEPRTDDLDGGVWFGALTPLALVLLAAIAAVLATRGWPRRLIGVLVALVAAVTAVPSFALLTNSGALETRAAALAELPARATVTEASAAVFPAVLTLLAALAAFGAGLLLARMPRDTAQLSGKYDNPVVRREAATAEVAKQRTADHTDGPLSERVLWDALDAGTDPTDDSARSAGSPLAPTSESGDATDTETAARTPDSPGGKAD